MLKIILMHRATCRKMIFLAWCNALQLPEGGSCVCLHCTIQHRYPEYVLLEGTACGGDRYPLHLQYQQLSLITGAGESFRRCLDVLYGSLRDAVSVCFSDFMFFFRQVFHLRQIQENLNAMAYDREKKIIIIFVLLDSSLLTVLILSAYSHQQGELFPYCSFCYGI